MADKRAIGIAGRALYNECVGGTDEAGDDICVMIGGEGDKLAKVTLDALEAAGYTIAVPAPEMVALQAQLEAAQAREKAALKAADTFAEDAHKAGAERDEALTTVRRVRELAQELQKSGERGYVSHVAEDFLVALDGE